MLTSSGRLSSVLLVVFLCLAPAAPLQTQAQQRPNKPAVLCTAVIDPPIRVNFPIGTFTADAGHLGQLKYTINWSIDWHCTGAVNDPSACMLCMFASCSSSANANGPFTPIITLLGSSQKDCNTRTTTNITDIFGNLTPNTFYRFRLEYALWDSTISPDCNNVNQNYILVKDETYQAE